MMKHEKFDSCEEALQRGEWLNSRSRSAQKSSEEVIRKSREAMKVAREIRLIYKGPKK